jgi:hypothetical protein
MKRQWCSILITFVLMSVIPSVAQCGMYTYQDVTVDSNGTVIGDNLVQATSCKQSSTSADAHITMPSGAQFAATSYGADVAEAVAYAPTVNEVGDGTFWGNNNASSDYCGYSDGSAFNFPLSIRTTTYGPRPIVSNDACYWTNLACAFGTPTCRQSTPGIVFAMSCPDYARAQWLVFKNTCIFAEARATTGPGECN